MFLIALITFVFCPSVPTTPDAATASQHVQVQDSETEADQENQASVYFIVFILAFATVTSLRAANVAVYSFAVI